MNTHRPAAHIELTKAADLDRMAALAVASGAGPHAELFLACRRGEIALVFPERAATISAGRLKRVGHPLLVVIGDDDYETTGPAGWASTPAILRWARRAIVHAAGAQIAHYREAVAITRQCRRCVLIETDSNHAEAWAEALWTARPRPIPFIGFIPREGVHPLPGTGPEKRA